MIQAILAATVSVFVLFVGILVGMDYANRSKKRPFVTKKRESLEDIVQAIKNAPEGAQIILPNPVKTAFDEGKVGSVKDIIV